MTDNSKSTETWNMGTETLKRLSRCLDLCSFYSQKKSLIDWYNASMDLRRNLNPFLTDDEFKQLNDILMKFPPIVGGKILSRNFHNSYIILDSFYMLAATYMKQKGLLMPKAQDPRTAVYS